MKTGHDLKYHQKNVDRSGKRAKSDTHWFPLGKGNTHTHTQAHIETTVTI